MKTPNTICLHMRLGKAPCAECIKATVGNRIAALTVPHFTPKDYRMGTARRGKNIIVKTHSNGTAYVPTHK